MTSSTVRIPNKKRGRPSGPTAYKIMLDRYGRNQADMLSAVSDRLAPDLRDELFELVDRNKTSLTTLAYVARFPHTHQRQAFDKLNGMGARAAKRYVECVAKPPEVQEIARRIVRFVAREFPPVDTADIVAALRDAADRLEAARAEA